MGENTESGAFFCYISGRTYLLNFLAVQNLILKQWFKNV